MSTVTPTQPLVSPPSILAPLTPRRITVDEYERIIASGSLNEPKKVELIDGYMVTRMAKSAEHGFSIKEVLKAISFNMGNRQKHGLFEKKRDRELRKTELDCKKPRKIGHSCMLRGLVLKALERRLPPGWTWRQEQPVRIPAYDEPEPDITIIRGSDADYRHRIPEATDVGLLVEVSATNVSADRQQGNLYGRSGIPVYWIVNLVDRRVEIYTDPGPAGYASRTDFPSGQQVPVVIDGRQGSQIAVDDILS